MKSVKGFFASLFGKDFMAVAFKVAVVVGSVLFAINHGLALLKGEMSRDRWISAGLTYLIPYLVNIRGQYVNRSRQS